MGDFFSDLTTKADTKDVWEMRWLSVDVPAPATDLQIERAKILWMLIEHHDVPVQTEGVIVVAAPFVIRRSGTRDSNWPW
jgi:hypothetical protein